jgi:hypothetical protein
MTATQRRRMKVAAERVKVPRGIARRMGGGQRSGARVHGYRQHQEMQRRWREKPRGAEMMPAVTTRIQAWLWRKFLEGKARQQKRS